LDDDLDEAWLDGVREDVKLLRKGQGLTPDKWLRTEMLRKMISYADFEAMVDGLGSSLGEQAVRNALAVGFDGPRNDLSRRRGAYYLRRYPQPHQIEADKNQIATAAEWEESGIKALAIRLRQIRGSREEIGEAVRAPSEPERYQGGWGPERTLFTINKPAPYPVFNSIIDNPAHGDERNFVQVKTEDGSWKDRARVSPGDTLEMFIYFDNSGADNFIVNQAGWIQGAKVRLGLVQQDGSDTAYVWAELSAHNCISVWDSAALVSDEPIVVNYDTTTLRLFNTLYTESEGGHRMDPDAFTPLATLLGHKEMDGYIRPGAEYTGYLTARVSVAGHGFEAGEKVVELDARRT
jgi:hypothetical protein